MYLIIINPALSQWALDRSFWTPMVWALDKWKYQFIPTYIDRCIKY